MSEKKPLVSIVIPCHNSGSTIKETLRSALSQTYTNLEIIVYNNYSNDITEKIVLEFHDPRVKYYKTNELLTMSESWTGASRLGTGDFLLLLCSDDVLDKKAIEILLFFATLLDRANPAAIGISSSPSRKNATSPDWLVSKSRSK